MSYGRQLQYATTGRASCKGKCKKKIEKGELRFGVLSEVMGHESWIWRCVSCLTGKVAKNAIDMASQNGQELEDSIETTGVEQDKAKVYLCEYVL